MESKSSSKNSLNPEILCGRSGTCLWSVSREGFPRQFLVLSGNKSLFKIIEIQCGDYLDEQDIERFDDFYGRISND